jgi:hypothetical protein
MFFYFESVLKFKTPLDAVIFNGSAHHHKVNPVSRKDARTSEKASKKYPSLAIPVPNSKNS